MLSDGEQHKFEWNFDRICDDLIMAIITKEISQADSQRMDVRFPVAKPVSCEIRSKSDRSFLSIPTSVLAFFWLVVFCHPEGVF